MGITILWQIIDGDRSNTLLPCKSLAKWCKTAFCQESVDMKTDISMFCKEKLFYLFVFVK
jgi:hypothetical protein